MNVLIVIIFIFNIIPANLNFVLFVVINILKNVSFLLHLNFIIVTTDTLFLPSMILYGIFSVSIEIDLTYYSNQFNDKYGKHGFKPGFILALHTFGRDDKWNPHINALMVELGVSDNNCKKIDFIPFDMLRKCFQKVLLDLLEKEIGKNEFRKIKKPPKPITNKSYHIFYSV